MDLESRLRGAIQNEIEENSVAGVSLLAEKGGQEICFLAEGMADRENEIPVRRDTMFRLFSATKPVTAVAAMILVERGKIDLCQSVSEFLPGFREQTILRDGVRRKPEREVRIFDLLNMTSGLVYPEQISESGKETAAVFAELESRMDGEHPMSTCDLANALGGCVLDFDPGTSWRYGTSADVLGAVVEAVSDMPLDEFFAKEILSPLEMGDTGFWVSEEKQNRLANVYETVQENEKRVLRLFTETSLGISIHASGKPAFVSGGAGMISTLDDYMKFAKMLRNGGEWSGRRILSPEMVKYMTAGSLSQEQQRVFDRDFALQGYSYSNLIRICKEPSRAPFLTKKGEYGWDGWLGFYFANFPKEDMTILAGMQKTDAGTWSLTRKLRNILLSELSDTCA